MRVMTKPLPRLMKWSANANQLLIQTPASLALNWLTACSKQPLNVASIQRRAFKAKWTHPDYYGLYSVMND